MAFMLPQKITLIKVINGFPGIILRLPERPEEDHTIPLLKDIELNSSQIMKNFIGNALIFGVCSDRNKRKQGSETRAFLIPFGAEVGLNYNKSFGQKASFRSTHK